MDDQIERVLASDAPNAVKLQLVKELRTRQARSDFHTFRRMIRPDMIDAWFTRGLSRVLQQFTAELMTGQRPQYVIEAPPQHGKSIAVIDLVAWLIGNYPHLQQIFTSYSDRLGVRANLAIRRIMRKPIYQEIFPNIPTESDPDQIRTQTALEVPGHTGIFRNTTVEGSITGESLDVGLLDDPLKGRKEANSLTKRNSVWDWFTDDFGTRFADKAGLLIVLTRWHIDDPVGRLLAEDKDGKVKTFKYPALADDEAELMPHDPRKKGSNDPLMPEHKSKEFLLARKAVMATSSWLSLYQGSPRKQGGEIIKGASFGRYKTLPPLAYRAMYLDTAQKAKQSNDYQVALVAGKGKEDGRCYVIDVLRKRFQGAELETRIPEFWAKHKNRDTGRLRHCAIEDKSSGTVLIQKLRTSIKPAIPVKPIPRNTDKYTRVMDVLGYIESGWVVLPEDAPWVSDFIDECEAFTADDAHDFDDQVDALVDAIVELVASGNSSPSAKDTL